MDLSQLKQLQKLPLEIKIQKTKLRIKEWYEHWQGNVYISFSGGKDSTVLLHLARSMYKDLEAVYCDTGLEYPELRQFVKTINNVTWIKPEINFKDVIERYGYPLISKEQSQYINELKTTNSIKLRDIRLNGNKSGRGKVSNKWRFLIDEDIKISNKCCEVMKKRPFKNYEKSGNKAILGTMAEESKLRETNYLKNGCNSFDGNRQVSTPLGFWTEQDILQYIKLNKLKIASVYGDLYKENNVFKLSGCNRTGCIFCMYGVHLEEYPNRFQKLEITHTALHNYCINKLNLKRPLELIGVPYTRPKVAKEKYKKETIKISYRAEKDKLEILKRLLNRTKTSELLDYLIDEKLKSVGHF